MTPEHKDLIARLRLTCGHVEAVPACVICQAVEVIEELADECATSDEMLMEDFAAAKRLRSLCAALYQVAGALDAPVRVLDALSAASVGEPFEVDGLLPVEPHDA